MCIKFYFSETKKGFAPGVFRFQYVNKCVHQYFYMKLNCNRQDIIFMDHRLKFERSERIAALKICFLFAD